MILEILISTMDRRDNSFLDKMFSNNNINDFNILIINQTTQSDILKSDLKNIRVINSFERGLSKSRNLAIKNAIGDICLFADDDVVYKHGFDKEILSTFKNIQNADVITFKMQDNTGKLFKEYPNVDWHNKKTLITVNSVVIAFVRRKIVNLGITFNSCFGLGAVFPTGDEYVFLRDVLSTKSKIYFEKTVILTHKYFSSGRVMGSDKMVFARSALIYKYSGTVAYLKLIRYIYRAFKSNEISLNEFFSKYLVGIKGICHYKELVRRGIEKR